MSLDEKSGEMMDSLLKVWMRVARLPEPGDVWYGDTEGGAGEMLRLAVGDGARLLGLHVLLRALLRDASW